MAFSFWNPYAVSEKLVMEFEQCQAFHTTMETKPYSLKNYINLSEWKLQATL